MCNYVLSIKKYKKKGIFFRSAGRQSVKGLEKECIGAGHQVVNVKSGLIGTIFVRPKVLIYLIIRFNDFNIFFCIELDDTHLCAAVESVLFFRTFYTIKAMVSDLRLTIAEGIYS